jgi:hypothetical protein
MLAPNMRFRCSEAINVDEAVLDVARSIRPYLPSLVGEHAAEVDAKLAFLLRRANAGVDVEEDLLAVLESSPGTHNWAAAMLADERGMPPVRQATRSAKFSGLPGQADPVDAIRYVCPVDHAYAYWRMFVGDPVPCCPDHPGTALVQG